MKLRILNNSVRLRLSKDDMDTLFKKNELMAKCQLLNSSLIYKIDLGEENQQIEAQIENNELIVKIPTKLYTSFYSSTNEGIYNEIDTHKNTLKIAIERDFKCLTPRNEDESDLFHNPRESH